MSWIRRRAALLASTAALLSVAACSSDTGLAAAPVKLLVTNATCATGTCAVIRVLAFPDNQPTTPGGFWSIDLGTVSTASACLTIPASAIFRVTDASTGATDTTTWTTARQLSVGSIGEGQSTVMASPSTGSFVPASRSGWAVTLPGGATPTAAEACR